MTTKQLEARSKGGYATLAKYGMKDMSAMGKKGGRPKLLNITEIRAIEALEILNKGG